MARGTGSRSSLLGRPEAQRAASAGDVQGAREDPETFKKTIFGAIDEIVGPEIRERHFTPSYEPWDQRVCVVPDGDLFVALRDGKADVVTGAIKTLTGRGILMEDGQEVEADIIVKATGLVAACGGEAAYEVDGKPVRLEDCWAYKGMAFSNVPNLVFAFGFLNASWTLRVEEINRYWCQILRHMDDIGASQVTPRLSDSGDNGCPSFHRGRHLGLAAPRIRQPSPPG